MTLFSTSWWQQACERTVRTKWGMRYLVMPQLTPYVDLTAEPDALRLDYYYEQTAPGVPLREDLPDKGFTVQERTTYVINDLTNISALTECFSENKRRQLKKAASLHLVKNLTPDCFYDLNTAWLRERGRKIVYTKEYFLRLADTAIRHDAGEIIALQGSEGETLAAAFIVYDSTACYYLVPGYNPQYGNSGAGARLVVEALNVAREKGCSVFDFEGGNNSPTIARHYSEFASKAVIYYSYERYYNPLFRFLHNIYKRFRA